METEENVLKGLLKEPKDSQTVTSVAKKTGLSRVGAWKALKKLEAERSVILSSNGTGKTSIYSIKLDWKNPLLDKKLALALAEESMEFQRWIDDLKELEAKADFVIIFGSIIHMPKKANDIDILTVADKRKLGEINDAVARMQKTQAKKIHLVNFTKKELEYELKKENDAIIDAIRKGIVLFGHEKYIRFMRGMA